MTVLVRVLRVLRGEIFPESARPWPVREQISPLAALGRDDKRTKAPPVSQRRFYIKKQLSLAALLGREFFLVSVLPNDRALSANVDELAVFVHEKY